MTSPARVFVARASLVMTLMMAANVAVSAPTHNTDARLPDLWSSLHGESRPPQHSQPLQKMSNEGEGVSLDRSASTNPFSPWNHVLGTAMEQQQQRNRTVRSGRQRRSLTKLQELTCVDREYPLVTVDAGTYVQVMSPGYPGVYPNNIRCGWKILTAPDQVLRVLCPTFRLGQGDLVAFGDHGTETLTVKWFTDTRPMRNVTTKGNKAFVGFATDGQGEATGFLCLVRTLPNIPSAEASPTEAVRAEAVPTGAVYDVPADVLATEVILAGVVSADAITTESANKTEDFEVVDFKQRISKQLSNSEYDAMLGNDALMSMPSPSYSSPLSGANPTVTLEYLLEIKRKTLAERVHPIKFKFNPPYRQVEQM